MRSRLMTVMFVTSGVSLLLIFGNARFGAGKNQDPIRGQAARAPVEQPPQEAETKVPQDPDRFAIIISGVGGEESYTRKFTGQALQLYQILTTRFGFVEKNVTVLTETGAPGPENWPLEVDKPNLTPPVMARSD